MNPLVWLGRRLADYLAKPRDLGSIRTSRSGLLAATLRKGDVLLVEGTSRFAGAVRYITQSTWSHAALYVDDALVASQGASHMLIEADVSQGVRAVPVARYAHVHTRICRPVGLSPGEIDTVADYESAFGHAVGHAQTLDAVAKRMGLEHLKGITACRGAFM